MIAHPVQVGITVLRHVVIEHNVDTLDVHSSTEQIRGHQYPLAETFECLILGKPERKKPLLKPKQVALTAALASVPDPSHGGYKSQGSSAPPAAG